MKRRRAPKATPQRICAYCAAGISEARPVFLVATVEGKIVGPYHAGCAARLSIEHKGKLMAEPLPATQYGQLPLAPVEDNVPW